MTSGQASYRSLLAATIVLASALLSGCDVRERRVVNRTVEGFRPSVLSGQYQYIPLTETRRIEYGLSSSIVGTEAAPGTVQTLATCKLGYAEVEWPGYSYDLKLTIKITAGSTPGESAPVPADLAQRAATATPSPSVEFFIPEHQRATIEAYGHYDKYAGTLVSRVEEFADGSWQYVPGSLRIWDVTFRLLWMDFETTWCSSQGIIV